MRYFPATDGNLCGVAYGTRAGWVLDVECSSLEAATALAARMNREDLERQQAARHMQAIKAAAAVLSRGPRAGVRYFEPDVFA